MSLRRLSRRAVTAALLGSASLAGVFLQKAKAQADAGGGGAGAGPGAGGGHGSGRGGEPGASSHQSSMAAHAAGHEPLALNSAAPVPAYLQTRSSALQQARTGIDNETGMPSDALFVGVVASLTSAVAFAGARAAGFPITPAISSLGDGLSLGLGLEASRATTPMNTTDIGLQFGVGLAAIATTTAVSASVTPSLVIAGGIVAGPPGAVVGLFVGEGVAFMAGMSLSIAGSYAIDAAFDAYASAGNLAENLQQAVYDLYGVGRY